MNAPGVKRPAIEEQPMYLNTKHADFTYIREIVKKRPFYGQADFQGGRRGQPLGPDRKQM